MQVCFLGDVGVIWCNSFGDSPFQTYVMDNVGIIWCNSFGDSHFQTYVMDNVEIVFNFYLHITSYVSHTHTSCTHYTQTFAKLYTYDCVSTNLAIFNCIWTDVQIQIFVFGWEFEEKCV